MSSLSEVEQQDTLPFVVDTTPASSTDIPKIVAPTIEQVDEDPEILRSLRGQGRYFGVDNDGPDGHTQGVKEAEPKCNNCSQRGHLKKNCPHVICTYCGSMDDHYSQHCPKAIKCSNCNENGHYRSQCPHKWKKVYCTLCNSKKHSRDRCPSIWRVYLLRDDIAQDKKTEEGLSLNMDKIFCYNCGLTGHFGDDCNERRSSRVPNDDGSAFSGDNLSNTLKNEYFKKILNEYNSSRRSYYSRNTNNSTRNSLYDDYSRNQDNGNNQFDYNDYEYDDSMYDDRSDNRNAKKSKKRRRNGNYDSYDNRRDNRVVQPTRRGKTLQPIRNDGNKRQHNNNSHPLTFPRSNNANSITQGLQNSRYSSSQSSSSYNNGNDNYGQNSNVKRYNSYKPFRSGVIKR